MRSDARPLTFSRPRQVRPPVRVRYVHPAIHPAAPTSQPVFDPAPSLPPNSFLPSGLSSPTLASSGGTPIPLDQLLNPTPGLGFDFNHLAAVNSGLAVRAFIDPVTQHELATIEQLPQEQPTGFFSTYFPAYAYGEQTPVVTGTSRPQVIVVQQPVAQPAAAAAPAPVQATPAAPPVPPLPVGVLYLVMRNGSVIHAIAFSQYDGQIVYITADGLRHSIALDKLDIQATEQRNAEHGTVIHLSE